MTIDQHRRAAHHHRHEAHVHEAAADYARERGDNVGAAQHLEGHDFHLRTAHHHETQAMLGRLTQAEIPAAPREPAIDGLTDGPVRPNDEAIVEG